MDSLTERVRDLYSQYPFPNAEYRMAYGAHLLRFFSQVAPTGKRSFLEGARLLDAGCGTGNAAMQLARQFPTSRVWGIDLSPASIAIAEENAVRERVTNLKFCVGNILTMDFDEPFDVILNMGVLHHLSDISGGIKSLTKHLEGKGYLVLWLYGKYGRFRLNLNQAMFRILFKNVGSLSTKVALTKRALASLPHQWTTCHFNVPRTEIEDDFEKSLKFAFENEAWLVDQFLHVIENPVDMNDILELLDQNGLRMTRWLSVSHNLGDYTDDAEIIKIFRELDQKSQLLILDLLMKPNYYLVAGQKGI